MPAIPDNLCEHSMPADLQHHLLLYHGTVITHNVFALPFATRENPATSWYWERKIAKLIDLAESAHSVSRRIEDPATLETVVHVLVERDSLGRSVVTGVPTLPLPPERGPTRPVSPALFEEFAARFLREFIEKLRASEDDDCPGDNPAPETAREAQSAEADEAAYQQQYLVALGDRRVRVTVEVEEDATLPTPHEPEEWVDVMFSPDSPDVAIAFRQLAEPGAPMAHRV